MAPWPPNQNTYTGLLQQVSYQICPTCAAITTQPAYYGQTLQWSNTTWSSTAWYKIPGSLGKHQTAWGEQKRRYWDYLEGFDLPQRPERSTEVTPRRVTGRRYSTTIPGLRAAKKVKLPTTKAYRKKVRAFFR